MGRVRIHRALHRPSSGLLAVVEVRVELDRPQPFRIQAAVYTPQMSKRDQIERGYDFGFLRSKSMSI